MKRKVFTLLLMLAMTTVAMAQVQYTFKGDYTTTCSGVSTSGSVSPYDKGATVTVTPNGNNYDVEITGLYVKIYGSSQACTITAENVPIADGVITTTEAQSKKSDTYVCGTPSTITITYSSTGSSVSINGYATTNGKNANAFTGTITSSTVVSDLVGKTSGSGGGSGSTDPTTTTLTYAVDGATSGSVAIGKTLKPTTTTNYGGTLSYVSSDESIATVDADGTIHGVAIGSATITVTAEATSAYTEAETTFAVTVTEAPKDGLTMAGAFVLQDDVAMNVKMVYTEFAVDGFYSVPVWYAFTVTKDGDAKINITYDDSYSKPQFTVYKNGVATDLTESKINYYNGTITLEGAQAGDVYHVAFSYNTCTTTITASQPEDKYTISWTVTGQLSRYNEEFYCMDQYYNDYTNGQQLAPGTKVILFAACDNERRGYEILVNGVDKTSSMVSGSLEFNISENTEVTAIFKYASAITEIDCHIATFNSTKLKAEDKLEVNDDSDIWVLDFRGASNDGEIKGLNMENHPNAIIYVDEGMTVSGIENNIAVYDGESTNKMENLVITDGYPFYILNTFNAVNASYSRTVNNTYGTLVLPYDFESDENVQFYTLDAVVDNRLVISEVDEVYAGTPVLFEKKTSANTLTIPATDSDYIMDQVYPTSSGLDVTGTFQKVVITDESKLATSYYIANDKFYQGNGSLTINPYRAYFTYEGAGAKVLNISTDETTVIGGLFSGADIEGIYDVNGVQQNRLQKGVNIVKMTDGKTQKVIVK